MRAGNTSAATGSVDVEDFASSYKASLGQVTGFFRAKGVPPEEAADLAHETILRTLVHLKRHGRERTDLGPLVRTIARNLIIERARRHTPQMVQINDEMDVVANEPDPADAAETSERRDAVRAAVAGLSPRHRHVVSMWMDNRTPTEIARELGIKRNAVDAILHRARRSLAAKLEGSGAFGVFGVVFMRFRVAMRRANEALLSLDPSGQHASAATGLMALGIAAVVSFSAVGGPSTSHVVDARPLSTANAAAHLPAPLNGVSGAGGAASNGVANGVAKAKGYTREISTTIAAPGPGNHRLKVGVIQETDTDGKKSLLGPSLNSLTNGACAAAPSLCTGQK